MKRLLMLFLAVVLLTGCAPDETTPTMPTVPTMPTAPAVEEIPMQQIDCVPTPYHESYLYRFRSMDFTEDYHMHDPGLQEAAAGIPVEYPLENPEQIQTYAWALYRICMEQEMFIPELIPQSAECYNENMWCITFAPHSEPGVLYCGPSAFALISGIDGHLIAFNHYGDTRGIK